MHAAKTKSGNKLNLQHLTKCLSLLHFDQMHNVETTA